MRSSTASPRTTDKRRARRLKISGSDADSVASILGLRFSGSWGAFKPQVAVGWEHEFD